MVLKPTCWYMELPAVVQQFGSGFDGLVQYARVQVPGTRPPMSHNIEILHLVATHNCLPLISRNYLNRDDTTLRVFVTAAEVVVSL